MTTGTFLAIGECMIEFSGGDDGLWRLGFAGDTLNAAWCARARLPADWRVSYFTRLGTERFSDRILAFLRDAGIGTEHVQRDAERGPGLYVIERQDGERSFAYWRESSAARRLADDEAALRGAVEAAEIVYVSGITLAILPPDRRAALTEAMMAARRRGGMVAFDPNIRPRLWESPEAAREALSRAAAAANVLLPSFDDEAAAFGDASPEATVDRYLALGAAEIVVKNGPGDVLVATGQARKTAPATPAERVVDTTGAGDAFNGAYLAARAEDRPPAEAAAIACAVARRVVGGLGALLPMEALRDAAA